ncbi:MAG: ABC transporter ATP-binding protein [Mycobacteriales bacterium]
MAEIELRALTKVYPNGVRAVDSLDLTIVDGEFFALLGPSGCGKTTLLRTIAGLEPATGGRLLIGGKDVTTIPPGARDVAMVFQDYALFPHMSVVDNIAYPLRLRKVGKGERRAKAADVGSSLSLAELMERRPAQLSGGQQQRVALARAIACRPQVFLFDEPLSNLDARLRLEARTFLKKLQKELGVTTVFVTHDQAEALALSDRMAVMEAGRIRQVGTPREVFNRPANLFVANFIGSTPMNTLDGVAEQGGVRVAGVRLPLPDWAAPHVTDGEKLTWAARPEYLRYADPDADGAVPEQALRGEVTILEHLGVTSLVTLTLTDGTSVQVTVPEEKEPAIGSPGAVVANPDRVLLYRLDDGELVGNPA